jgi:hypothetical protein
MYRADFVVGRIAQVFQIEFAHGPFARAGRVLDALATIGNTGVMKGFDLPGAGARVALFNMSANPRTDTLRKREK